MLLRISTRTLAGVTVVDCYGRIVLGDETAFLRQQIKDLLLRETRQLVVNLADVNYIDSSGLGTLAGLYASTRNAGGDVKLAALTSRVKDVLQITKLGLIFECYDTAEQAAATFPRPSGRSLAAKPAASGLG
jgi:anti-sigma B factor antagonist